MSQTTSYAVVLHCAERQHFKCRLLTSTDMPKVDCTLTSKNKDKFHIEPGMIVELNMRDFNAKEGTPDIVGVLKKKEVKEIRKANDIVVSDVEVDALLVREGILVEDENGVLVNRAETVKEIKSKKQVAEHLHSRSKGGASSNGEDHHQARSGGDIVESEEQKEKEEQEQQEAELKEQQTQAEAQEALDEDVRRAIEEELEVTSRHNKRAKKAATSAIERLTKANASSQGPNSGEQGGGGGAGGGSAEDLEVIYQPTGSDDVVGTPPKAITPGTLSPTAIGEAPKPDTTSKTTTPHMTPNIKSGKASATCSPAVKCQASPTALNDEEDELLLSQQHQKHKGGGKRNTKQEAKRDSHRAKLETALTSGSTIDIETGDAKIDDI